MPVVIAFAASEPTAVLLFPVASSKALAPTAVFPVPLIFVKSACNHNATLLAPEVRAKSD
jgi:hypothetical protein